MRVDRRIVQRVTMGKRMEEKRVGDFFGRLPTARSATNFATMDVPAYKDISDAITSAMATFRCYYGAMAGHFDAILQRSMGHSD